MFSDPMVNVYSHDIPRLTAFYESIGFRETFRTPKQGAPDRVEVRLDHFSLAISSVQAAIDHHGHHPRMGGRPIEIVLWSDDADGDYAKLTADGAPAVIPPHDFLGTLRVAWVEDPDGNPVQLVERRDPPCPSVTRLRIRSGDGFAPSRRFTDGGCLPHSS